MTSAFTSLAAPALEDTMEVSSSPAGNVFDNDIDIDYDDFTVPFTDDERMLEDGDPSRPPTATDEMMDDDEHTTTLVDEEVMQDDPPNDQTTQPEPDDEELIDYDDEVDQSFFDDTTLQNTQTSFAAPTEAVAEPEQIDDEVIREPELIADEQLQIEEQAITQVEDAEAAALEVSGHEENAFEPEKAAEPQIEDVAQADQAQKSEDGAPTSGDAPGADGEDLLEDFEATAVESAQDDDATASLKAPPQMPGSIDITAARNVPDGPPTPTDTGLHPVTINYRANSMPMFKSSRQPDGLLKNDNLASIGLSNLMQDCKDRLRNKLGEEIAEDHELVLGFDRLGLMLVEGTMSTFNTSLNDVIQLWVHLHKNDGLAKEDVPALSVTLTSQPKFSASFAMLQKVVNEGQGISSFVPMYSAENEDYGDDDQEGQAAGEHTAQEDEDFAASEEQHEEHANAYAQEDANAHDPYQGYEGNEYQEEPTEEPHGKDQADQYPEDGYEDDINYEDFDQHEEYPDPEDFDQDGANAENSDAPNDQSQQNSEAQVQSKEDHATETVKPDSAASSTTVRGDIASGATGEYEEDLIDWDDDVLTGSSETDADDGHDDDFSTQLTEHDANAGQTGAKDLQTSSKDTENAHDASVPENEASSLHPPEDQQNEQATFDLGSEDFLGADLNNPADPNGEQYNPNDNLIEYEEEETFNEADYIDFDNEGEDQLGEDDEQFHTALDLLDGDDTEHGPETTAANAIASDEQLGQEAPDEDDIGFQDDYDEPETTAKGSMNSPLGKRSFEEHADEDELAFDDEPELKKARSD